MDFRSSTKVFNKNPNIGNSLLKNRIVLGRITETEQTRGLNFREWQNQQGDSWGNTRINPVMIVTFLPPLTQAEIEQIAL